MIPYNDINRDLHSTSWIRIFDHSKENSELVWHRDVVDRTVEILEGIGWKVQLDNVLPIDLIPGNIYHIPAMQFHRVLKGITDLKIRITES